MSSTISSEDLTAVKSAGGGLDAFGPSPIRFQDPGSTDDMRAGTEEILSSLNSRSGVWSQGQRIDGHAILRDIELLTRRLLVAGVKEGEVVSIEAHRSSSFITALLSVWAVGAIPFAIDERIPSNEVQRMAESSGAVWRLSNLGADLDAVRLVGIQCVPVALPPKADYLLATSGSTGTSKVVCLSLPTLLRRIRWQIANFGLDASDRYGMYGAMGHDPVLRDIFAPILTGADLFIPQQAEVVSPGGLGRHAVQYGITILHCTPQMLQLSLIERMDRSDVRIRLIFSGGATLSSKTVDVARQLESRLVNVYGATETPQIASYKCVEEAAPGAPYSIGTGAGAMSIHLASELGISDRHPNEVVVRGTDLAVGYSNSSGPAALRSSGSFEGSGYFTGDIGVRDTGGSIVLQGRVDRQLNVSGYRIEPSVVEEAAVQFRGVSHALVRLDESTTEPRLQMDVVAANSVDLHKLKAWLRSQLPREAVPSVLRKVDIDVLDPNFKRPRTVRI